LTKVYAFAVPSLLRGYVVGVNTDSHAFSLPLCATGIMVVSFLKRTGNICALAS
jgi:hypothetical protein